MMQPAARPYGSNPASAAFLSRLRVAFEGATWMRRGACKAPNIDPDWFFPSRGQDPGPAKAVCATCVVKTECLEYAIEVNEGYGIWGGEGERARRRIKRQRANERRKVS